MSEIMEGAVLTAPHIRLSCELNLRELYSKEDLLFLLEENDTVEEYEKRSAARPSCHDTGLSALGSSLDRVEQVEAIHQYNELKTELSDFLRDFAQEGKVVSKRDIEGFFEEIKEKKRQKLNNGEGVPPSRCHF